MLCPHTPASRFHATHTAWSNDQAIVALIWAVVGLLGLFAATVRRLQSLAIFCSLEIFSTLLSACVNGVLLLLYHLQCSALTEEALRIPEDEQVAADSLDAAARRPTRARPRRRGHERT